MTISFLLGHTCTAVTIIVYCVHKHDKDTVQMNKRIQYAQRPHRNTQRSLIQFTSSPKPPETCLISNKSSVRNRSPDWSTHNPFSITLPTTPANRHNRFIYLRYGLITSDRLKIEQGRKGRITTGEGDIKQWVHLENSQQHLTSLIDLEEI